MKRGTDMLTKFKRLKDDLGLPTYACKGLLQELWDATATNAIAGDIGKHSDDDIAYMLDWQGDPAALVAALVKWKWLDPHPEHRLVVHDWPQHCEDWIHMRLARATLLFADGTTPKVQKFQKDERDKIRRKYFEAHGIDPCHVPERAPAVRTASAHRPLSPNPIPESKADMPGPGPARFASSGSDRRSTTDSEPKPIGDTLAMLIGGDRRGRQLAEVIVVHSQEEPRAAFVDHYAALYRLMAENGGADLFEEKVEWIQKSRDPAQRRAKNIGNLHSPGGFIQGACKKHLEPRRIAVPTPPTPSGGIPLAKS